MRASRNWLEEHVDLSGLTAAEIAHCLTFAGVEVEGMEERGGGLSGIVVAAIRKCEKHPNAERLSVCMVDDGSGTLRQIVCGAKNFAVGDHVPLAPPGIQLPGGTRIRAAELRGAQSDGMLCSGAELGLDDDASGLLILDRDSKPGQALADLIENDAVFELEITPNRPDLLSHRGIARELAAATGREFRGPPALSDAGVPVRAATAEEVRLEAPELCPLYTARRIRGVKVGPSPDWLRRRLESIGVRSVNNIVDITNFVLFETGQPLHAFDWGRLQGGIVVRRGGAGESFLALDGETYHLTEDDVVIADHSRAVAIGGVMGGEESGVTENTADLLLESACFLPAAIRRTSRRLGLSSDSSYRFERGVDPCQTAGAADLATRLILETAGGTAEEVLTAGLVAPRREALRYDYDLGNRLLGIDLAQADVDAILGRLGLRRVSGDARESWWEIPSYRLDLERTVDLIEEVVRMHGLDRVSGRRAALLPGRSEADERYDACMQLRAYLAGAGFLEARTMKLIAASQLKDDVFGLRRAGGSEALTLLNPMSDDHTCMRPSLIPGLLAAAERNARMGANSLRFFELGAVFSQHPKSPRATEAEHVAILLGGLIENRDWLTPRPRQADFAGLRGIVEGLA
ncbi:MAG TPA: phenylalanine--tRNA ligase subunit beta, partial [Verrucomicrobiales bacterium]|nr:phenylalanine--tRNA ligase subunit beta [Verrucomicrobiales bacterium]